MPIISAIPGSTESKAGGDSGGLYLNITTLDVEYRTNECFNDRVVYKKLLRIPFTGSGNTDMSFNHNIADICEPVRLDFAAGLTAGGLATMVSPGDTDTANGVACGFDRTKIYQRRRDSQANTDGYYTLYYTKFTDTPSTPGVIPAISQELGDSEVVTISQKTLTELINSIKIHDIAPEMHRMTFRGKYMGEVVTEAQIAAIRDGSFDDLFTGDYWIIGNMAYRIVDMNYWLGCGDTIFSKNHLVLMPDDQLYAAVMNATNITTGGYSGSAMRTTHLTAAKNTIKAAFPGLVLTHRQLFENAVTNGKPSAGAWVDSEVDLANEPNMYGSFVFRPANDGITIPYKHSIDKQQFALFALQPKFIICGPHWKEKPLVTRRNMWLRDVVSAANFASVGSGGNATTYGASDSHGVRPCFAIG